MLRLQGTPEFRASGLDTRKRRSVSVIEIYRQLTAVVSNRWREQSFKIGLPRRLGPRVVVLSPFEGLRE